MINSRKLTDLHPKVATMAMMFIAECKAEGIDLLVTSTFRDFESQEALYAQGRTTPGNKVTNARGGQSYHQYRVALDIVPLRNGKPLWDAKDPVWQLVGAIGKKCGFEWAGEWKRNREYPHFQYTDGLSIEEFQKGIRF